MINELVMSLLSEDLNTTVVNIVVFLSCIQLVGFLFLLVGNFIGSGKR